ncbi:MAG: bifunctional proline dehydrogenase/L-glutamate gamma-semialdehyde dehydrogenase, partial [Parachlamydiaceae bacterium]|nr:bifunctional proline dehydrogenase/L-glutamate gamma-semialdehyde dehydrogenase [Parachlamydiaceae bacterium]
MINQSESIDKAKEIIASVKGTNTPIDELKNQAIELAGLIIKEAVRIQTESEKQQQAQLARMMEDPHGKAFTSAMTDQCFRSRIPSRTADQLLYLIKTIGVPKYLSTSRRMGLRLFKWFGGWMPKLFVGITKKFLRQETSNLIIPGEEEPLIKHLIKRRKEGVRINLNHLGEAILGEEEAKRRLNLYLADLKNPYIEYVSIKISTIYSQISSIAQEHSIEILAERLRSLYRTAKDNLFTRANGTHVQKFVNLDMEEYKDLEFTELLFCKVLSEPEFHTYSAGIVLQSYIPDAFNMQKKITEWAMLRCNKGGSPIKIRIVKGANLAMEQVEASLKNWHQAPFLTKMEVDANYKRMLVYGCKPEHSKAVELGVATHNVFDTSLALLLRAQNNLESSVSFEMLEGMADNVRRALQMIVGEILLYCPVSNKDDFQNAMAYLVRRLDENTAPHNFLRHLFGLRPGTKEWHSQVAIFSEACSQINMIPTAPRRTQNRLQEPATPDLFSAFDNEPDTDWSLPDNIEWSKSIISNWENRSIPPIPIAIGGKRILSENEGKGIGCSPSAPSKELYRYSLADSSEVDLAITTALHAQSEWSKTTPEARSVLLAEIAKHLRANRAELIGAMMLDGGKTIQEADSEVSEAIDFAEYYRRNIEEVYCLEDVQWNPKGTVLVTPPWNFPCSIPAGCILAALATGNTVIFKPSPQTVLVGWLLVQAFWKAGIDESILQFLTCDDEPTGSALIKDPRIAAVLLTGATATAKEFLKIRPALDLIAETGGKNSMIITSLSDRDLAIKELIQSAFSHAGQKCSACSLAILEAEVYDDPHFRMQLRDAAASLSVGSPFSPQTKVNPLIDKPGDVLQRGLTQLDEGEEWLLKPIQSTDIENLWSPGIKLGVKKGSFTHQNELFGPVLALMRADNLTHAIKLANDTPYGLTAGLQSLDPREQALWLDKIEVGNCYINRTITGAIVQRQPFGGCKASSFGKGAKAGGPNFLMQLMQCKEISIPKEKGKLSDAVSAIAESIPENAFTPEELNLWQASAGNYAYFWNGYFSKSHDPSNLVGQDNLLSYRPQKKITVRAQEKDLIVDLWRIVAATVTVGCPLEISGSETVLKRL